LHGKGSCSYQFLESAKAIEKLFYESIPKPLIGLIELPGFLEE
jgi:hypothetical protein